MKSSEVSIKTRSTPASLSFKGPATKHTTVKWSIVTDILQHFPIFSFVSNYCDGPLENKKGVFLRDRSANKREKLNNALHKILIRT